MKKPLVLAFLALGVFAQASVSGDIDRQYKRWGRAALTNDVDTILSILAPDYTLHTYTGVTIPRKDYEASLRKRKASGKPATAYVTKIAKVTVEGKKALVISDETSATVSKDPITNQKVKLIHIHRYLDTWVRGGSAWRLRSTVTQVESTTVVKL
jgi:hypothetical protein